VKISSETVTLNVSKVVLDHCHLTVWSVVRTRRGIHYSPCVYAMLIGSALIVNRTLANAILHAAMFVEMRQTLRYAIPAKALTPQTVSSAEITPSETLTVSVSVFTTGTEMTSVLCTAVSATIYVMFALDLVLNNV